MGTTRYVAFVLTPKGQIINTVYLRCSPATRTQRDRNSSWSTVMPWSFGMVRRPLGA